MPGNPRECRQHAQRCAQLANEAVSPDARRTFLTLSQTWLSLAAKLESASVFLNAINGMEIDLPPDPIALPAGNALDSA